MSLKSKLKMVQINSGKTLEQLAEEFNTTKMNASYRVTKCRALASFLELTDACGCDVYIKSRDDANINLKVTLQDIIEDTGDIKQRKNNPNGSKGKKQE